MFRWPRPIAIVGAPLSKVSSPWAATSRGLYLPRAIPEASPERFRHRSAASSPPRVTATVGHDDERDLCAADRDGRCLLQYRLDRDHGETRLFKRHRRRWPRRRNPAELLDGVHGRKRDLLRSRRQRRDVERRRFRGRGPADGRGRRRERRRKRHYDARLAKHSGERLAICARRLRVGRLVDKSASNLGRQRRDSRPSCRNLLANDAARFAGVPSGAFRRLERDRRSHGERDVDNRPNMVAFLWF